MAASMHSRTGIRTDVGPPSLKAGTSCAPAPRPAVTAVLGDPCSDDQVQGVASATEPARRGENAQAFDAIAASRRPGQLADVTTKGASRRPSQSSPLRYCWTPRTTP